MTNKSKVYFTEEELQEVRKDILEIIKKKNTEAVHISDNGKEFKRWETGMLGELAVEKYLNLKFTDRSVGDSKNYSIPDLNPYYNVGVKSSRFPNFPVINRNIDCPQIFVILLNNPMRAVIVGLADMDILQENLLDKSNDDLVFAKSMLARKTAFSRYELLKPITDLSDLEPYKKVEN